MPSKKQKIKETSTGDSGPTYIEMIADAIASLGGQGTTPEITNIMEVSFMR